MSDQQPPRMTAHHDLAHELQAPQIMMQRPYHHGNLLLQLIWDPRLEIYSINIHRDNDRSDHDLWGIWLKEDYAGAVAKFQSIQL